MADDFEQYKRQGEDFSQYKRTSPAPTSEWDQVKQVGSSLGSKIADLGRSAVSGVQDIANSNDPLTEIANKAGGMASGIVQPMYDSLDRYKVSAGKLVHGDTSQILPTVQHAIGAAVPFVGPADAAMEQAVQEKQKTGSVSPNAIADVTLQGVAPIVAPSIARGVGRIATEAPAAVSAVGGKLAQTTPKQVAQTVGGVAGAGLGHGSLSIPGAYYGVKGAGGVAEGILGKDVANSPIFGEKPVYPGAKLPARPDAKFLKQNIATPMQEGSSVLPPAVNAPPVTGRPSTRLVLTPEEFAAKDVMGPIKQRLASENGMHYAAMGKSGKLPMKTGASPIALPENAARVISGKATVIPAPSSEAFGPQPEGFVTPGNDDMTELLRQSLAIKNGKIAVPGEGEPAAEFERRGAPRGIQPEADQAYLATLEQKIANNAPDRLQAIQARTDLLNRMNGVQVPPTDVASRAQAGLTRKMSQPRAEVTAPAATRKDLNMTEKDFLNLRKNLRTKSGL